MNEIPLYLLIDQGGQSSRVFVIDAGGRERLRAHRPVVTHTPGPGRAEQDGERILADLQACLQEAFTNPELVVRDITAAGLAVQRGNVLCWDRITGHALTPVLSWHDQRQPQHAPPADIGERVRNETGLRHSPYGGAAKLKWCLEAVPEVSEALARDRLAFGPLGAFLVRGLVEGNPHLVDETLAQRTLLFSRRTRQWSPGLLEAFGLPAEPLPAPVPAEHDFGSIVVESGLRLPLRLLIGDQNVVPDIDAEPDCIYVNLGTGAFLLRPLRDGIADFRPEPFQLTILGSGSPRHDRHNGYALEGSIHAAGSALDWLAGTAGVDRGDLPFDEALAPATEPGLFLDTAGGLGSPWWCRGNLREFIPDGLTLPQRLAAVVENLVFLLRVNLELLERKCNELGCGSTRRIVVAGGLSGNERLCRRIADGLGRPVQRLRGGEATGTGIWRRLSRSTAPGPGYQTLEPEPTPNLERRYRQWRGRMPPVNIPDNS